MGLCLKDGVEIWASNWLGKRLSDPKCHRSHFRCSLGSSLTTEVSVYPCPTQVKCSVFWNTFQTKGNPPMNTGVERGSQVAERLEAGLDCRWTDPSVHMMSVHTWICPEDWGCWALLLLFGLCFPFYFKLPGLLSASVLYLPLQRWGILLWRGIHVGDP